MNQAAIDIGSNSILLAVVSPQGKILHDEARVVSLGQGLGDRGLMRPDRLAAAEAVLTDYVAVAATHGVEARRIKAVATSAARRALNAETFFASVLEDLGLQVRIVTGEEEAQLTWLGATRDLSVPSGARLVVDLGGGSTEFVLGEANRIVSRTSLEIGSVRLTEAHLCGRGGIMPDRVEETAVTNLRKAVDAAMVGMAFKPWPGVVVGTAGTVTTLAAMQQGLKVYKADAVHGTWLTKSDLGRLAAAFARADGAERRALAAVSVERADYLLAGAITLEQVLISSKADRLLVSERGLRFGLLA